MDVFQNLNNWIHSLDISSLKKEYITFSNSLTKLSERLHLRKLHTDFD